MREETWKPVVGFERRYEVSDLGRVRVKSSSKKCQIGKTIGCIKSTGYHAVVLRDESGNRVELSTHKLVLEAFVSMRPDGKECNHKNGDKADNRVDNLEWVTRSENHIHRARVLGHHPSGPCLSRPGERNGAAKLTRPEVDEIRRLYAGGDISQEALGRMFGVHQTRISRIVRLEGWK